MIADPTLLILPGLNNSGPEHWQSRWEVLLPNCHRVEQSDWDRPQCEEWLAALDAHLALLNGPVIFIAHSLGCVLTAHWARLPSSHAVVAALLVAPPDIEAAGMPAEVQNFTPVPLERLPFPSLVVTSSNDSYCSVARGARFASAWGSRLVRMENAGHINGESGLGDWPEGQRLLSGLMQGL